MGRCNSPIPYNAPPITRFSANSITATKEANNETAKSLLKIKELLPFGIDDKRKVMPCSRSLRIIPHTARNTKNIPIKSVIGLVNVFSRPNEAASGNGSAGKFSYADGVFCILR